METMTSRWKEGLDQWKATDKMKAMVTGRWLEMSKELLLLKYMVGFNFVKCLLYASVAYTFEYCYYYS